MKLPSTLPCFKGCTPTANHKPGSKALVFADLITASFSVTLHDRRSLI